MMTRPLGKTGFSIAPLVFGGNVFGWTIDEKTSFAILDAFIDHGFDAIDTADVYSRWADGNQGGESETIIGRWLQARPGMRDKVKLFTKVGSDLGLPGHKGLKKAWIQQAVDDSLRRLNTDYIDLYFSHWPDPETPVAETLDAFHALQQAGKSAPWAPRTSMRSSFQARWRCRVKAACRPGRCCSRNTIFIIARLLRARSATCASAAISAW